MQGHYETMMVVKRGIPAFGHGVRPDAWRLRSDARGDRIAATRSKRAP